MVDLTGSETCQVVFYLLMYVPVALNVHMGTVSISHGYFFQIHFAYRTLTSFGVGLITFALHRASVLLCISYLLNGRSLGGSSGTFIVAGAGKQSTKRQNKKYLFHNFVTASRTLAF